jgi:hypothetical protein
MLNSKNPGRVATGRVLAGASTPNYVQFIEGGDSAASVRGQRGPR